MQFSIERPSRYHIKIIDKCVWPNASAICNAIIRHNQVSVTRLSFVTQVCSWKIKKPIASRGQNLDRDFLQARDPRFSLRLLILRVFPESHRQRIRLKGDQVRPVRERSAETAHVSSGGSRERTFVIITIDRWSPGSTHSGFTGSRPVGSRTRLPFFILRRPIQV